MNEKKITGVRVYILTVDSETNTVLKCEEQEPNTGQRTELAPTFKMVPVQYPAPEIPMPAGFLPSIVILVGGQASAISRSLEGGGLRQLVTPTVPTAPRGAPPARPQQQAAEDKLADKGQPPKV